ncbi:MAG: Thiamin biosynthesis lipoprotein ApbE [uncultured Sulfurovum sp.]|uniref:FAD:protein FMN transferase n=1 Tax=uncultured Sulfurovum sp. TaxID=269237 RepID=A0A6S6U4E5_9BACT|nr:MAG: Thiamin biosynthesis lipoprotein ApbE [uncultured Sulfurovum sp.]
MTSPCELQLYCNDEHKARAIAKKIMIMAKRLENKYNFYNPDSYLSELNQRKTDVLDTQTKDLLTRAKLFYKKTNGVFDITMGTLTQSRKLETLKQIEEASQRLKPFLGVEHFKIKKNRLTFNNPHTLIDFGGFVKEFAVDQAVKILKKEKITTALVNFAGDIYALGLKPNKQRFSIGIKNPLNPSEYLTSIKLSNQALTTSASYERSHKIEEKSFSHIISSSNLQDEILSATVVASSVVEAGVFSTALMIKPQLETKLEKLLILKSLKLLRS